jgi:hypothetical protein
MATPEAVTAILAAVPDPGDLSGLEGWFAARQQILARLRPTAALEATLCSVDVGALVRPARRPFGHHADPIFRKLVVATLLADWGCYTAPVDQVGFERLLFVMHVFPAGFRGWWVESPDDGWLPVGYTGWYPISEATFEMLASRAAMVRDRSTVPLPVIDPEGSFFYLFNYSILPAFRRGPCSRQLVRGLAEDIQAVPCRGLAAITVSEDGARVAERFGMRRAGSILVEGCEEWIYASRRDALFSHSPAHPRSRP